jgi:hypothetical protein
MKADPLSLFEEFIKGAIGSQYVIPVYQRNYTWKKSKQVQQLLEDIKKVLSKESPRHFLGSIVYVITKTDFIVREREVVDGQQRLVTMFLVTYALKEIAYESGDTQISDYLVHNYLENNEEGEYKYRLKPSVSDDDAYWYIASGKTNEYNGNSLIMENFKYIKSVLGGYIQTYSMLEVINAVRNLYIVRIELEMADDAQQIFESINSTGEKLTPADLIRNYIMMNRNNTEQESIYHSYWLKLEHIFPESKKLSEFFRFYLAVKNFVLITEKDLYEAFKQYWNECLRTNAYTSILDDLLNYAHHFERLYLSIKTDELGESILDFRKMQSFMPAPFMMRILEHFRVGEITRTQTAAIIKLLNTYLVRRYINDQDTSAISRFFPGYLRNVESQCNLRSFSDIYDICVFYLINENKGKAAYMPDDTQTRTFLSTANAYTLSNIRWILDKIEMVGNPISIDLSSLSIEHIMPQTSNDYWNSISGLSDDEYTSIVNRLGNLTLAAASDNSKMGNNDFKYKKSILASTKHLRLNAEIYTMNSWTVSDIDTRTQELINTVITLFPYVQSNLKETKESANRHIALTSGSIAAFGYLNEDNSLTVFTGSEIRYSTAPSSSKLKELREDLLEQEIIEYKNGRYLFAQDYAFGSPSGATDFILGGSNNGWNYWKDDNGQIINDSLRNI